MVRPVSEAQLLPNAQGEYQPNPIAIAAIAATMMASQFTFPSSRAHARSREKYRARPEGPGCSSARAEGYEHRYRARVRAVRAAEPRPHHPFLGDRAQADERQRHAPRPGRDEHVPRRH